MRQLPESGLAIFTLSGFLGLHGCTTIMTDVQIVDDDDCHGAGILGILHLFGEIALAPIDDRDLARDLFGIDRGTTTERRTSRPVVDQDKIAARTRRIYRRPEL